MRNWHGASQDHSWPCGKESVFIVDPNDGQVMNLMDLENKYDRVQDAEYREQNPGEEMLFRNGHPVHPFNEV